MIKNLKSGLALNGYDAVSYFTDLPKKGESSVSTDYLGARYLFSSEDNKKTFLENPEKFIPAYGGFCAIAMSEGSVVDANPKSYLIEDDRLFVFYAVGPMMIINTRNQWLKKGSKKLIIDADDVYESMKKDIFPDIKNTY